jgi:hypothetical protein
MQRCTWGTPLQKWGFLSTVKIHRNLPIAYSLPGLPLKMGIEVKFLRGFTLKNGVPTNKGALT